jgi:hypothetical protein
MIMIFGALWEEGLGLKLGSSFGAGSVGVGVGEVEVERVEKTVVVTGGGGMKVDVVCTVTIDEEAGGMLARDRRGERIKAIPAESAGGTVTVWTNASVVSAAFATERRKTPRYSRIR